MIQLPWKQCNAPQRTIQNKTNQTNRNDHDLEQGLKSFVYCVPKKQLVAAFQCAQKTGQKKYSGELLSM